MHCFRTGQVLVHFELGIMKSSIHVVLFFLLSLVASMALPRRQAQAPFAVVDFSGKAVSDITRNHQWLQWKSRLTQSKGLSLDPDLLPSGHGLLCWAEVRHLRRRRLVRPTGLKHFWDVCCDTYFPPLGRVVGRRDGKKSRILQLYMLLAAVVLRLSGTTT